MRWLLVCALAGCGFDLEVSVRVRPGHGSFELAGKPLAVHHESFTFFSFQSALDDPTFFHFTTDGRDYALPYDVSAFRDHDCSSAEFSYLVWVADGGPYMGVTTASCHDGDAIHGLVVD